MQRQVLQHPSRVQRELARVVLNDTLPMHVLPGAWLGCEVTALPGRAMPSNFAPTEPSPLR